MKKQSSSNREFFCSFSIATTSTTHGRHKLATSATHANNLQTENTHCPRNLQIETTILIESHTLPKLHKILIQSAITKSFTEESKKLLGNFINH